MAQSMGQVYYRMTVSLGMFFNLGVVLQIGLLIGTERGWKARDPVE